MTKYGYIEKKVRFAEQNKYDKQTKTFLIFINYDKSEDIMVHNKRRQAHIKGARSGKMAYC
jgi:hypothetical protein